MRPVEGISGTHFLFFLFLGFEALSFRMADIMRRSAVGLLPLVLFLFPSGSCAQTSYSNATLSLTTGPISNNEASQC